MFALAAVLALVLPACGTGEPVPDAAGRIPDAALLTFDDEPTSVHAFLGQPLVINFWASWCAPCIAEMPDFQQAHLEVGDEVRFLGIDTQDAVGPALELIERTGVTYDLVRDPEAEAFEAFGVRGMPSTFFVDRDGRLVFRHAGPLTEERLLELIDRHLGDRAAS